MPPTAQNVIKKMLFIESIKSFYRGIAQSQLKAKLYNWVIKNLSQELYYTPQTIKRLGIPEFRAPEIIAQEQVNNEEACQFFKESLELHIPYSTEFVKKTHQIMLSQIMLTAGEYRRHNVRLAQTDIRPPAPGEIYDKMVWLDKEYNKKPANIVSILDLHYNIVVTQPFADGNKRVARWLLNYELLRNNYGPLLISAQDNGEYINALEKRFVSADTAAYYAFMLNKMQQTIHLSLPILRSEGNNRIAMPIVQRKHRNPLVMNVQNQYTS